MGALFAWGALGRQVVFPERSPWLDLGLGVLFALWIVGLAISQRRPAVPALVFVLVFAILGLGWISVLNAKWTHSWSPEDRESRSYTSFSASEVLLTARAPAELRENLKKVTGTQFSPSVRTMGVDGLPRSIDQDSSRTTMIHLSAIFAGMLVVIDLARSRRLRRQLLGWLALAGLAVAMAGVFQKASGTDVMWNHHKPVPTKTFFAAFGYHGSAATFLNLCWPAAALLWLRALSDGGAPFRVTIWACCTLLTVAAAFANTSKVGHVLTVALMLVMLIAYRKEIGSIFSSQRAGGTVVVGVALAVAAGAMFLSFSAEVSLTRWLDFETSANSRLTIYEICWKYVSEFGLFGYGPGTFPTAFAYMQAGEGILPTHFTYRAHEDYLQLAMEWGYAGAGLWLVLLIGALCRRNPPDRRDFYVPGFKIMLLAVLIHATVDFPLQVPALQWPILALTGILWAKTRS